MDAVRRRRRVRALADPEAARAVPRPVAGADRLDPERQRPDRAQRSGPRPLCDEVPDRGDPTPLRAGGQRLPGRRLARPAPRPGDRAGHRARVPGAVAGVRRQGGGHLRRRLQLHLQPHHRVARPADPAPDGAQPARGLRADVRRRRQHGPGGPAGAAGAEPQPARLGRREGGRPRPRSRSGRRGQAGGVPRRRAGHRAADPAHRGPGGAGASGVRPAGRACPRASRTTRG